MTYHFTPPRMAKIKKIDNNNCSQGWMWGNQDPHTVLVAQPFWKTVWQFLKVLNTELPYDSAISFLGYIPKRTESMFTQKPVRECSQRHYS